MDEEKQSITKTGVLKGTLDGILMKTFWDKETAEAKKDFSYLVGNVVAGSVQPLAYFGFLMDFLVRDKYLI